MTARHALEVGSRLTFAGDDWLVVGSGAGRVQLRQSTAAEGTFMTVRTGDLVQAPDFRILDVPDVRIGSIEHLPQNIRQPVEELIAHLNEAQTGYRSGDPAEPAKGEPRPEYDPSIVPTVEARFEAKARELRKSSRQVFRWASQLEDDGPIGLVPKRALPPGRDIDPRVLAEMEDLRRGLVDKSTKTKEAMLRQLRFNLRTKYGAGVVPVSSDATLLRVLKETEHGRKTHDNARRRRTQAVKPAAPHQDFMTATRPGQVLVIDSTPGDFFAVDPISGEVISLELLLCIDLFSRRVVAYRFTTVSPKSIDAALLLADAFFGIPPMPGWPDMQERYTGLVDRIVLPEERLSEDADDRRTTRRLPCPDEIVADRALIYKSAAFRRAVKIFDASLHLTRVQRGPDKAHIERMFRTIGDGFWTYLPGHKGSGVEHRGRDVEAEAIYFPREVDQIFAWYLHEAWHPRPHDGIDFPGVPEMRGLSPNEMHDAGMALVGDLWVPSARDLYYELLPVKWRRIRDAGVTIDYVPYRDVTGRLHDYRWQRDSRYSGARRPFRFDPRNLSRIWFQLPDSSWVPLARSGTQFPDLPFTDVMARQAKELALTRRGSDIDAGSVSQALDELIARVHSDQAKGKDRRRDRNARHDMAEALRDYVRHAANGETGSTRGSFEDESQPDETLTVEVVPTRVSDFDGSSDIDYLDADD